MKKINPPPAIRPYRRALALRWPIEWFGASGQETCQSVSDPRLSRHEIWLTALAECEPEAFLPDIVHELCRLCLAERADPAFATIRFSDKWNRISREEPERFGQAARMIFLAWSQVDIWVNDIRHERWPELTDREHASFSQGVEILIQREEWGVLSQPESLLGLAQHQAERERHVLAGSADLFAVLSARGIEVEEKIHGLAEFFRFLPRLQFKASEDLKILETSVREVARRLEFPINPKLVSEEGIWVWDLG